MDGSILQVLKLEKTSLRCLLFFHCFVGFQPKFEQPTVVTITSTQAGLIGVPTDQQRWTEGGVFLYKVRLNAKPKDQATVTVTLISSEPRCNILTESKLIFTENNWNKEQEINIEASDDTVYFAKDAVSYTCLIKHGVTSTDGTSYASNSLNLDVLSTGCTIV